VLSGRGLCDEPITHPEESYRLCCVVVCDLETSRMGAVYIYIYIYIYICDISRLRVNCPDVAQSGRWSSFGKRVWFTESLIIFVISFYLLLYLFSLFMIN